MPFSISTVSAERTAQPQAPKMPLQSLYEGALAHSNHMEQLLAGVMLCVGLSAFADGLISRTHLPGTSSELHLCLCCRGRASCGPQSTYRDSAREPCNITSCHKRNGQELATTAGLQQEWCAVCLTVTRSHNWKEASPSRGEGDVHPMAQRQAAGGAVHLGAVRTDSLRPTSSA